MTWSDGKCRCRWANPGNPRYIRYHDEEWGVPVHDDRRLFEMLILEGFQAGLSCIKSSVVSNAMYSTSIRS